MNTFIDNATSDNNNNNVFVTNTTGTITTTNTDRKVSELKDPIDSPKLIPNLFTNPNAIDYLFREYPEEIEYSEISTNPCIFEVVKIEEQI